MTNVSGWLPWLIGPVVVQDEGTDQTPRMGLNFIGFSIADNPTYNRLDIGFPEGASPPTGTGMVTVTGGAYDPAATVLATGIATFFTTPTGANLAAALTTALPASKGGTGLTALGAGVATWFGTPSSANLLAAITDETGTGSLVFHNTPALTTPRIYASGGVFRYTFNPSAIAADRIITLPLLGGDDTFVFVNATQTLTNKTINGASNTLTVRLGNDVTGSLPIANGGTGNAGTASAIAALAIDWTLSGVFTKTLSAGGNTFTFSNAASGMCIVVRLTGAASTVTWPTVKWAGGAAPVQTASGIDVYTFVHDGTSIYGSVVQAMA